MNGLPFVAGVEVFDPKGAKSDPLEPYSKDPKGKKAATNAPLSPDIVARVVLARCPNKEVVLSFNIAASVALKDPFPV